MKKCIVTMLIIFLLFGLISCEKAKDIETEAPLVSLWQIVTHPERFHGKRIQTIGFASVGFERSHIQINENIATADENIAVPFGGELENDEYWQKLGFQSTKDSVKIDQHYVLIEGVFDKNITTMFSRGGFSEITKCELWGGEK